MDHTLTLMTYVQLSRDTNARSLENVLFTNILKFLKVHSNVSSNH